MVPLLRGLSAVALHAVTRVFRRDDRSGRRVGLHLRQRGGSARCRLARSDRGFGTAEPSSRRGRVGPRWWWSNPGQSAERVAAAHERSESCDPEREGDAVAYALETLTRVVAAPHTKWSIVYDARRRPRKGARRRVVDVRLVAGQGRESVITMRRPEEDDDTSRRKVRLSGGYRDTYLL